MTLATKTSALVRSMPEECDLTKAREVLRRNPYAEPFRGQAAQDRNGLHLRPSAYLVHHRHMGNYFANSVGASNFLPNRFRANLLRLFGVSIGRGTHIHSGLRLREGEVKIGAGVFINRGCGFDPGSASIDIEDGVSLGEGVLLLASSHEIGPTDNRARGHTATPIRVERGSWLGARVVVLPGVTVAHGCIIGAGAVVTKSTQPNGIYAGVPARLLRTLPES
jgi:maltose O-acetyltransferase